MKGQKALIALLGAAIVGSSMPGWAVVVKAQETLMQQEKQDGYEAIREYWTGELLGETTSLQGDKELLASIEKLDIKANNYLNSMQDVASCEHLWVDDAYMNAELGAKATETLDRLKLIAIQTLEPNSSLYQNEEAINKVKSGLRFVLDKKYGPTTAKGSSNWWDWEIGAPKAMVDIAILYYDVLDEVTIKDVTKTIDRFIPYANRRGNASNGMLETGANLCDKVAIMIKRAALDQNEERMSHAKTCMSPLFAYSTTGDGYYPDGSFIQHGNIPYNGSYGYVVLNELTNCIMMLSFTEYAIDTEDIKFYENTLINHYIPFISYGGNMVDSVRGRAVSRKSQQGDTMGMQTMGVLLQYAQIASPSVKKEIQETIKGIVDEKFAQEQTEDFSMLAYADYIRVKSLYADKTQTGTQEDSFNIYSNMDRSVANRDDYTFTLAANSIRMCTEYGNQENVLGRYQGQGYTQLYNNDINQYNEDYNATVDQKRLTGVTTAHQELGFNTTGQSSFSGGATLDGINGVSGFELNGNKQLTRLANGFGVETDTGIKSGISAKKSYFVFGDSIVYLGSGISNASTDPGVDFVESIVENRKTFDGMTLNIDGANVVESNGKKSITNPSYAYLSGKTADSGIGYVFLEDMDLDVKRETRNASWNDVNKLAKFTDMTPVSNDFVSMAVNHGTTPSNDTYSWVTLPNATEAEVAAFKDNPSIEVIANTTDVQAVLDKTTKQQAFNFFKAGTAGDISVNAACSVVLKEDGDGYEIAVSDPTRSKTSVELTIDGFTSLEHVGISEGTAEVLSTTATSMTIRVNFASKDGQSNVFKVGAIYNTKSENLALNKTVTASSVVQNANTEKRLAKLAVDGKLENDSRWASNYERSNSPLTKDEADQAWFEVDLGSVQTINQVKIYWEAAVSNDYDILVAGEDKVFKLVTSHTDTTSSKITSIPARLDDLVFDKVEARYVKLQSKLNSRPLIAGSYLGGISFYEFEVYNALDLKTSAAKAENLLSDYPEAAAFATPTQYTTLKTNLETALDAANQLMDKGTNYTDEELTTVSNTLNKAISEFDKAVLHVTEIRIDGEQEVLLNKGASYQATAIIQPENAYNKRVTWSTGDSKIATVDEQGVIKGIANGETTIKVTSEDQEKTSTIKVIVDVRPETITLNKETLTLLKGESETLSASIAPLDVSNATLLWESSNPLVATVDTTGKLVAVGVGSTTITVTSEADPTVKATCVVEVKANLNVLGDNLSLDVGTQATASSTVNATGVTPMGAIDGDPTTRWASNYRDISVEEAEAQWFMIELPEVKRINHIDITWFSETTYGKEYKILTSEDGVTFEEAYHETNGGNKTYGFDFEAVSAKFVKFQGISRTNTSGGYGICEFAVYNKLSYDTIVGKANNLLTLYPVSLSGQATAYQTLKDSVDGIDQMIKDQPNFTSDELGEKLKAVEAASTAYEALIVPVTGIENSSMTMKERTEAAIVLQINPATATNKGANYESSDTDIVSVSDDGMLTAHKEGVATIHVTTIDGNFEAEVTVNVNSNRIPSINASDITLTVGDAFDPLDYASAIDHEDGKIEITTQNITENTVDMSKPGTYRVTYQVIDQDGNQATKTIRVLVVAKEDTTEIRTKLQAAIQQAYTLDASAYTAESYAEVTQAIAEAKEYLQKDTSSIAQLQASLDKLETAVANLVKHTEGSTPDGGDTTTTPPSKDDSTTQKPNEPETTSPSTSDSSNQGFFATLLLGSAFASVVGFKKLRRKQSK